MALSRFLAALYTVKEVAKLVEADLDLKRSGRSFENRGRGRIGFDSHSHTTNHEGEKDKEFLISYIKKSHTLEALINRQYRFESELGHRLGVLRE